MSLIASAKVPLAALEAMLAKVPAVAALRRILGRTVSVPVLVAALFLLNWESLPFMYHIRTNFSIFKAIFLYAYRKDRLRWFSGVPEPSPSDKARSAPITRRDESNLRFFAGFGSCDWNWHLNNGIYNTLADFSRIDLYIRSGLGDYMHRHKHITANGGVAFAYIKEIPLFTTFHVRSSFKAFDRKWFIAEHRFESRDGKRVYAIGHSRIVIKERSGKTIAPQKVLEEMRDLGILPGWAELSQKEITKDTPLNPPKIQDCCKAVMVAEKALELHALEEELEHQGRGWVVGSVDGGTERV